MPSIREITGGVHFEVVEDILGHRTPSGHILYTRKSRFVGVEMGDGRRLTIPNPRIGNAREARGFLAPFASVPEEAIAAFWEFEVEEAHRRVRDPALFPDEQVTRWDSLAAGNCAPVTDAYCKRWFPDGITTAGFLLSVPEDGHESDRMDAICWAIAIRAGTNAIRKRNP